ncbi:MAG: hypothetical protein SFU98_11950 [Leptospiraceae bacterium]|nr:hypothetical protein [Leptospiraceae bacterium]
MRKTIINLILLISISLNILLTILLFINIAEGCAEIPNGRLGILKNSISIGYFSKSKKLFTLPKGLVVRDASASGASWFERHRFRIVITSESDDLVDYNIEPTSLGEQTEYYSADIQNYK